MKPSILTVFEHQTVGIGEGPNQLSDHEAQELLLLGKSRPGFCTPGHHSLRLAQYAGLVRAGERIVEVLPKLGEEQDRSKSRGTLLRMLRLALDVPIHTSGHVGHDVLDGSLLEIFISAYLEAVSRLVRKGLACRYRQAEEDLTVIRGRLLLARQAGTNALRPDRIACRFDQFDNDHPWNQVLKAGLVAVRPWIRSLENGRRWIELNSAFDGISYRRDMHQVADELVLDRQLAHYADGIRWARWILRLLSPGIRAGEKDAPELLFDMNRLFESAVATQLRRRIHGSSSRLVAQEAQQYMLRAVDEGDQRHLRLKPDLVLRSQDAVVAVADTKWVSPSIGAKGRVVPPESHVYQMHAYASVYPCQEFMLIYPWHEGLRGMRESQFILPSNGAATRRLHIVCVDVGTDTLPVRSPSSASVIRNILALR